MNTDGADAASHSFHRGNLDEAEKVTIAALDYSPI
jgi:hypothetical protein